MKILDVTRSNPQHHINYMCSNGSFLYIPERCNDSSVDIKQIDKLCFDKYVLMLSVENILSCAWFKVTVDFQFFFSLVPSRFFPVENEPGN